MNEHLHDLLIALYLSSEQDLPELIQTVEPHEVEPLLELSSQEKLFPHLYRILSSHFPVDDKHREAYGRYTRNREEALRILSVLAQSLDSEEYLLVKGLSVEAYYAEPRERFFYDLDISVPTMEQFFKVGQAFLANGLDQFSTMLLYQETGTDTVQGGARFESVDEHTGFYGVELQIGTFPISFRSYLPWDVFTRKKTVLQVEGGKVSIPDREGNLLIYLAEMHGRDRIMIRDLLDMRSLLDEQHASAIDLEFVADKVCTYQLQYSLWLLGQAYAAQRQLTLPGILARLMEMTGVDEHYRYEGLVRGHLRPYFEKVSAKPRHDFLYSLLRRWTDRMNDQDKLLNVLKRMDQQTDAQKLFVSGFPVYFMKLNSESSPWEWREIEGSKIVLSPIGSYAVSANALFSDEELDHLENCLQN